MSINVIICAMCWFSFVRFVETLVQIRGLFELREIRGTLVQIRGLFELLEIRGNLIANSWITLILIAAQLDTPSKKPPEGYTHLYHHQYPEPLPRNKVHVQVSIPLF